MGVFMRHSQPFSSKFRNVPHHIRSLVLLAACVATFASSARAQNVQLPSGSAPAYAIGFGSPGGPFVAVDEAHPLPVAGLQENFALVTANTASAPVTIYGGDYVFAQSCSGYGTVALQVRGPDGASFQTIVTKTAADSDGGAGVALGSNAVVRVTVTGATACNATLSRVP